MKACRLFPIAVVALLVTCSLCATRAQNQTQPQKQDNSGEQEARPKVIKSQFPRYPDEAVKRKIEGKVVLSIVVDTTGRVSDAKPLSGPPELFQAAIECVKQWEYEPPAHGPVATTAELTFGFPADCASSISDAGEVQLSGRLLNGNGKVVGVYDSDDYPSPPYFEKDREAGVAGEMVLSIALGSGGKVKKIHVVKSLSRHLDKAAVKTVHSWRFKLVDGNTNAVSNDLHLHIFYRATCHTQFDAKEKLEAPKKLAFTSQEAAEPAGDAAPAMRQ